MDLSIHIDAIDGGSRHVALAGRLDTHTYEELDRQLASALGPGVSVLVFDLARLEYISSAGIRSVFKARKVVEGRGGKVVVANLQPQIRKVFDIVKAVPMNAIFASVQEADRYLHAMPQTVLEGEDDGEP